MRLFALMFGHAEDDAELAIAQVRAFSKHIPVLYSNLMANTIALAYTHFDLAPTYLTVYLPAVLGLICFIRYITWMRSRKKNLTVHEARKQIRVTQIMATSLGIVFAIWALNLYGYGDIARRSHVAFYMGITIVSCVFCIMHNRTAALMLTFVVMVPFVIFFAFTGEKTLMAIAANIVPVSFAMIYVLQTNYSDFVQLIDSRRQLVAQQAETQQLSDENLRLANLDPLTGLPNRRQFLANLEQKRAQASAERRCVVAIVDLDGFKPVNDAFGHSIGDRVLRTAGQRMLDYPRVRMQVARLGGDEFGLIFETDGDDETLLAIGNEICDALRVPLQVRGGVAQVSASIGLTIVEDASLTAEQVFENADYALYDVKLNGKGRAMLFSKDHAAAIAHMATIEQALRVANLETEMSVVYQPIVDVEDHRTIGFEALARWSSPGLGTIAPAVFIQIAERTGLIDQLTPVILRKALRAAKAWPQDVRLSFNLSGRDLGSRKTIADILRLLDEEGFDPMRLDIEVSETEVLRDAKVAPDNIQHLIALGISLALDDFGTSQSSLRYVHQLPLRKIKIDRSFVTDVRDKKISRDIIRSILDLCKNIDCTCVVEGVETAEQLMVLRTIGCRYMQGFFLGVPMSEDEIELRLAMEAEAMRMKRQIA